MTVISVSYKVKQVNKYKVYEQKHCYTHQGDMLNSNYAGMPNSISIYCYSNCQVREQ